MSLLQCSLYGSASFPIWPRLFHKKSRYGILPGGHITIHGEKTGYVGRLLLSMQKDWFVMYEILHRLRGRRMFWLLPSLLLFVLILVLPRFAGARSSLKSQPARGRAAHWIGTWGAAPVVGLPVPQQDEVTFRNIVHTSIAGALLRVQFSNRFGTQPVLIIQATVALPVEEDSPVAEPGTMATLTFAGSQTIAIPPGQQINTDPLAFFVPATSDLFITISIPRASGPVTTHPSAHQTSWYAFGGNHAADLGATAFTQSTDAWSYVTGVEVQSSLVRGTLVALGDSITAGTHSTSDADRRWPDDLARRLLHLPLNQQYGIVNEGIAGNRLLVDSVGPSVFHRLNSDVFGHSGVKVVVVLEGINDIRNGAGSTDIIAGLKQIATLVHARGIRLLVGTLTPFAGSHGYTRQEEKERQRVNAFLRAQSQQAGSSLFDGVIDFDAAVRDPGHPLQFLPIYDSGDHLHPSDQGYQAMSDIIALSQL
jgi:lysophospholipase L1-like esterase